MNTISAINSTMICERLREPAWGLTVVAVVMGQHP
jgi:hypothetical protein